MWEDDPNALLEELLMGERDLASIIELAQSMYQAKEKERLQALADVSYCLARMQELKSENTQLKAKLQLLAERGHNP